MELEIENLASVSDFFLIFYYCMFLVKPLTT